MLRTMVPADSARVLGAIAPATYTTLAEGERRSFVVRGAYRLAHGHEGGERTPQWEMRPERGYSPGIARRR